MNPGLLLAILVLLTMVACNAETEPATNVMDRAVNLNAKVEWSQGEAGQMWFEYRPMISRPGDPDGGWMQTVHRQWGPMPNSGGPVTITEKLRFDCADVEGACTTVAASGARTLVPSQRYEFKFCGLLTATSNPVVPTNVTRCFASAPDPPAHDPPYPQPEFDQFTTLEPWDDDTTHPAAVPCPASGPSWVCYEPEGPSTRSHSDYSRHYTNGFLFGIGPIEYGACLHQRDVVFNGRRAHIFQSCNRLRGVALRHDFRMKVYRGTNHLEVDSYRNRVPDTGFTSGNAHSGSWFVLHSRQGPYHIHFRDYIRAEGVANPNRPDGLWVTPTTATDYYSCPLDADGERICKFED